MDYFSNLVEKDAINNMLGGMNYRMSWYPMYVANQYNQVNNIFKTAAQNVVNGKEAARTAMDRVTPQINEILKANKGYSLSFSYIGD